MYFNFCCSIALAVLWANAKKTLCLLNLSNQEGMDDEKLTVFYSSTIYFSSQPCREQILTKTVTKSTFSPHKSMCSGGGQEQILERLGRVQNCLPTLWCSEPGWDLFQLLFWKQLGVGISAAAQEALCWLGAWSAFLLAATAGQVSAEK